MIRAEYERHRHAFLSNAQGFHARGFAQRWVSRFHGRGFTVEPEEGSWRWGLERVTTASGLEPVKDVNRLTYHWSDGVQEWFVNDPRGLEHGFTLSAPREIRLRVRGELRARGEGASLEFVDASGVARVTYSGLQAWDADGRRVPARLERESEGISIRLDDRGARYPVTVDPLAQEATLKPSNDDRDLFGSAVAIGGDTVVVGAPSEDSNARGVNGDGGNNAAPDSGGAYVFVRNAGVWKQQAYIKAPNADR